MLKDTEYAVLYFPMNLLTSMWNAFQTDPDESEEMNHLMKMVICIFSPEQLAYLVEHGGDVHRSDRSERQLIHHAA